MSFKVLFLFLIFTFIGFSTEDYGPSQTNGNSNLYTNITNNQKDGESMHIFRFIKNLIVSTRDSVDDFPQFIRQKIPAVIVAFLIGMYCFTFLAILCDKFFVPSVEQLCRKMGISEDIGAATFMSMATSTPEFFVNVVSTFISESDLGVGTVVGSSMFNSLFTPALGCLAVSKPLQLDWWPISRDCSFYMFAITLLVIIIWDGYVYWYEAMTLFIVYIVYFIYMFLSIRIANRIKKYVENSKILRRIYINENVEEEKKSDLENNTKRNESVISKDVAPKNAKDNSSVDDPVQRYVEEIPEKVDDVQLTWMKEKGQLFSIPEGSIIKKIFFIYTWPIRFLLTFLMPNPVQYPRLTPITFLLCIACIGMNSYVVSWMVTIIGDAFNIPETIMGFTLSAGGGALPEAFSLVAKARKGDGAMGVSNSLGANTMNILMTLGTPWFVVTLIRGVGNNSYVELQSGSIHYSVLGLNLVVGALYVTLMFNKFQLAKRTGFILLCVWVLLLSAAISIEMLGIVTTTE